MVFWRAWIKLWTYCGFRDFASHVMEKESWVEWNRLSWISCQVSFFYIWRISIWSKEGYFFCFTLFIHMPCTILILFSMYCPFPLLWYLLKLNVYLLYEAVKLQMLRAYYEVICLLSVYVACFHFTGCLTLFFTVTYRSRR